MAALSWVNSLQKGSAAPRAGISPLLAEAGLLHLPLVVLLRVRALTPSAGECGGDELAVGLGDLRGFSNLNDSKIISFFCPIISEHVYSE